MSDPKIAAFFSLKGQSKRLAGKNFANLGGRPLYAWTASLMSRISQADEKYVLRNPSLTLDLEEGVETLDKPPHLDSDDAGSNEIIQFFSEKVDADWYLYLHATAPFTSLRTVNNIINTVLSGDFDSGLSVRPEKTFGYYREKPLNFNPLSLGRTQEVEPILVENSGAYFFSRQLALKGLRTGSYPYFCNVSWPETIDIDHLSDYQEAILALPAADSRF